MTLNNLIMRYLYYASVVIVVFVYVWSVSDGPALIYKIGCECKCDFFSFKLVFFCLDVIVLAN